MFTAKSTFSGISVTNIGEAKEFYSNKLGLVLEDELMGLQYKLPGGGSLFIYQKENHIPATFTVLNFVVDDIDSAVNELIKQGIVFERYEGLPAAQDELGILRGRKTNDGPDIAWLKDTAGNILSVLQN